MNTAVTLQPDVTLTLDASGVIRSGHAGGALAHEAIGAWLGRSWKDTIIPDTSLPDTSAQVSKLIADAQRAGSSSLFQFRQRFPSGLEVPMEYSAVSLGDGSGFIAIGKSLQVIADLQTRLQDAIQAREQDYWKLRDIESRYRLLFDSSNEAVLLVRKNNLRIVEANLAASRALGLLPGAEFPTGMSPRDRRALDGLLDQVREGIRTPGIILHFGRENSPWSLRASSMDTPNGSFFLFQMSTVGGQLSVSESRDDFSCGDLIQRLPDAFVVVDSAGVVKSANLTFLDLVQIGAEGAVLGENLNRWLTNPGSDAAAILAMVQRHGSVSLLPTSLAGELGSNVDVEVSAVGEKDVAADFFGLLLRDVTARTRQATAEGSTGALLDPLETNPQGFSLEQYVRNATSAMEQRLIASALQRSEGNRTVAARKLGLSRQSLHTKLKKYKFE